MHLCQNKIERDGKNQILTCSANLSMIEEDTKVSTLDGSWHISIGEDDVRGLAAQLESHPLQVRVGSSTHDKVTNFSAA